MLALKIELKPIKVQRSIWGFKMACLNELLAFLVIEFVGIFSGFFSVIKKNFAQEKLNSNKHIRGLLIAEAL